MLFLHVCHQHDLVCILAVRGDWRTSRSHHRVLPHDIKCNWDFEAAVYIFESVSLKQRR